MVRCNLIKLGVGWPEMWPERTDLRHKLVRRSSVNCVLGLPGSAIKGERRLEGERRGERGR